MGKSFEIGDVFRQAAPSDDGRERIEYIAADKLRADGGNFYSMEGLQELAASIEFIGLQQPLRVRPDGDGFTIVSGHRRYAAIDLLRRNGAERWEEVPCIVERQTESDAMRELRLIFANKDTRRLTNSDIDKQAQRVEELLRQLQAEGVEFPGRMRDYVAEICQTSKSKLSRLKQIREGLAPCWAPFWESGEISEAVALRLVQEDAETQESLYSPAMVEVINVPGIDDALAARKRWSEKKARLREQKEAEAETETKTETEPKTEVEAHPSAPAVPDGWHDATEKPDHDCLCAVVYKMKYKLLFRILHWRNGGWSWTNGDHYGTNLMPVVFWHELPPLSEDWS